MESCKWTRINDITAASALGFLGDLRAKGLSAQTYNHDLKSLKSFTRWLVRDRRTPMDPIAHLSRLNLATDRRHDRRALSEEEFRRLLEAARVGKRIEGMAGPDFGGAFFSRRLQLSLNASSQLLTVYELLRGNSFGWVRSTPTRHVEFCLIFRGAHPRQNGALRADSEFAGICQLGACFIPFLARAQGFLAQAAQRSYLSKNGTR